MHVWWRVVVDKDREPNAIKPQRTHLLFYPRPIRDKLKSMIPTLEWLPEGVNFLDQTKLPLEETYVLATDYKPVSYTHLDVYKRQVGGLTMGADPLVSNTASASAWALADYNDCLLYTSRCV